MTGTERYCTLCRQYFYSEDSFWSHRCYEGDSKNWKSWIEEQEQKRKEVIESGNKTNTIR